MDELEWVGADTGAREIICGQIQPGPQDWPHDTGVHKVFALSVV